MAERRGCTACFKTLDPNDPDTGLRTFVKCKTCNREYHALHWANTERCLNCGGVDAVSLKVAAPKSLPGETKRADAGIKPTKTVTVADDDAMNGDNAPWIGTSTVWITYVLQVLRAMLVGLLLVTIASVIGTFVYRLTVLDNRTLQSIMDALFKQALPAQSVLMSAFVASTITAWVFYPRVNTQLKGKPSRFTRFIAGLILLAGFNVVYFRPVVVNVLGGAFSFILVQEAWIAQVVSALVVLVLTPLQHRIAPISALPSGPYLHPVVANIYGWIRLLLAWLLIVIGIALVVGSLLPAPLNTPFWTEITVGQFRFMFTAPMVGAALACIVIGSVIYWPPAFRRVTRNLLLVRLLLAVMAFVAIGMLYSNYAIEPVGYLDALILGVGLALLATPLQRTLS